MRIAEPVLPLQMESAISLEEALSMAQSDESALEAYRFCLKRENTKRVRFWAAG